MQNFNETGLEIAWSHGRQDFPHHSLTVMVKGTFRLQPNGIATLVEEGDVLRIDGDRHFADDTEGSLEYATDFAIYKPATDILFKGSCYTPNGEEQAVSKVRFGLKGEEQSLYVFGDRQWQNEMLLGKIITEPKPFTQMPLCYENSFGGADFEANPVGKGVDGLNLPNIEHPDFLIESPEDRPQPVGFAPLHSLWQPRKSKMGTFNKSWEEQRWPWFPVDMDWSLFNAAPAALQRLGFLKGDETLMMENLHPTVLNYSCQLPALRSRCFINAGDQKNVADFKEVALNLDTLWVDGDEELMVLVWRGVTPINDRFHEELKHLLLVTEPLASEPQAEAVYREQLAQLLNPPQPETEAVASPLPEPEAPPESVMNVDTEVKKALDESRAALKGMNLPEASMDALNKEKDPGVFLDLLMKALGVDPEAAAKLQHETLLNNRKLMEDHGYDPNLAGRLKVEQITSREDVIRLYAEGRDFSGVDMSNLDLQGLDLHEALFSHTLLFNTNLNKCNLKGANLNSANLDSADLSDAILEGADLTKATLRNAKLVQTNLQSALLQEAKLNEADLSQANLSLAQLQKARLDSCVLNQANLTGADLSEARLIKTDLTGANLNECNASKADFTGATLDDATAENADLTEALFNEASVRRANLTAAVLTGAQCKQANFETALMTQIQAGETLLDEAILDEAKLDEADFSAASLKQASLKGASMRFTRFRDANLEQALLDDVEAERADFSNAQLVSAQLQKGQFSDADFSAADVSHANFEQATLTRASFTGAIASHANMRLADMTEVRAGGGSNFDHANLEQVSANGAIWMQSSLREANLKWADMQRCNLNQTDLSGAYCVAADMKNSDFTRANLQDADLSDCNLFECLLESATITRTKFIGSNLYGAYFHENVAADARIQESDFEHANLKRTRLAVLAEWL
jgi:uncharacterized protein YjbI with pentapeptide repeats